MSKQLLSNTQQRIQKSIKNIETFDLPIDPTLPPHFETKEEWLEEQWSPLRHLMTKNKVAEP